MPAIDPIFKDIFGTAWEAMPIVFKKHYQNRPYCNDITQTNGIMSVYIAPFLRPLTPLIALSQTLISQSGNNIKTIVKFKSNENDNCFRFEREFEFNDKKRCFNSKMEPIGDNQLIEWTQSGIGWGCAFVYNDNKISLLHRGYFVKLFGKNIRLPIELFVGKGYAYEQAKSNNAFDMYMEIKHSLFGKIYSYSGTFYID
jgi:hypothetical protein